ncbi:wd repeat-containing protein [Lasius niger]|uniref:Wd repeat-containing protein n=1 Tax=Lasius niger TaxID=67767 RepID=A0A0J7NTP9_LASNI|nr:wd repeat-containing protein [Lasius niger]
MNGKQDANKKNENIEQSDHTGTESREDVSTELKKLVLEECKKTLSDKLYNPGFHIITREEFKRTSTNKKNENIEQSDHTGTESRKDVSTKLKKLDLKEHKKTRLDKLYNPYFRIITLEEYKRTSEKWSI